MPRKIVGINVGAREASLQGRYVRKYWTLHSESWFNRGMPRQSRLPPVLDPPPEAVKEDYAPKYGLCPGHWISLQPREEVERALPFLRKPQQ